MKSARLIGLATAMLLGNAGFAQAEGELHIFNWGNYTNPELIEKFAKEYQVNVTLTDYDSNETALDKVRAGGHGFDIVVPSANYMPIWIEEGLLLETRPDQMANFKHVDPRWVEVDWDPGRHYSVPWQWGSAGVIVNKSAYSGDPNTSAIFMDPPAELVGKINVVPEKGDVMALALMYVGAEPCADEDAMLTKVREKLLAAKPKWMSIEYETDETTKKYVGGELGAGVTWSGAAFQNLRVSEGRIPLIHGQRCCPQGGEERRERQALPELHHGTGKRCPHLSFRAVCQWHPGIGRLPAGGHEERPRGEHSRRVCWQRHVQPDLPSGGAGQVHRDLE
jgi:spermidine/putrescine transport system substrate-binding protein